ncbi:MAG: NnrU family protein [Rhodocyclaceae bacterium]|nr:NnrU family protein [Rhodocyclaceae bacterium]MBX3667573.1 NnrU family protein [Rhodocyclaceae bacterium]
MLELCLGLALLLGVHSIRIGADGWRSRCVERFGLKAWKAGYALASLAGFALIVHGFGLARAEPVLIWPAPVWARHLAALATLAAFILLAASHVKGSVLRARSGHPMVAGTLIWALAHLAATGKLHDLVLFGAFALWALVDFVSLRARDQRQSTPPARTALLRDAIAVGAGTAAWALFAWLLHGWLIGVRPFG